MDCPICLEKLSNSVAFACGHGCCLPCLDASEIQVCPLCRKQITSQVPTPWLDFQNCEEDQDNSKNYTEERETNIQVDLIEYYLSKPIVDPRGNDLRKYYQETMSLVKPIVSNIPNIIEKYQTSIETTTQEYQQTLKKLEAKYQEDMKNHDIKLQKHVQKEETKIKEQEYHNQGMTHLATTLLSLSIQSTEVLNQALPVYESKIADLPSFWPLGISPMKPKGDMLGSHYVYIPEKDDFVYELNGVIHMGTRSSKPDDYKVMEIKYCSSSPNSSSSPDSSPDSSSSPDSNNLGNASSNASVSNSGVIYVMTGSNGLGRNLITYDLELNIIKRTYCCARAFYLDNGKPVMVEAPDYSGRHSITYIGGAKFRIEVTMIGLIEFMDDKLYIYDYQRRRTTVYWTQMDPDSLKMTLQQRVIDDRPLVVNGKLRGYSVPDLGPRITNIIVDGKLRHTLKGIYQLYPGRGSTILCKNGSRGILVQID